MRGIAALVLTFLLLTWLGLILFSSVAKAAGDGQMQALVPEEWRQSVFEVTCTQLGDCCGVHRECGDWYTRPDYTQPAPVPLPGTFSLLMFAICFAASWWGLVVSWRMK